MAITAFLETPNAIRRRKVLMHILVPILGTRESLDAVVLWEKQFGSNELLLSSTVEYSKLVCSKFAINMEPLSFSNKFIQTLLKPPANIADLHDPIGMGRILLARHLNIEHTEKTDKNSVV